MLFDFDKFADITASVFPGGPYTLDEALGVFRYYFEQYEAHTGRPHPPICASQIVRIVRDMPWIEQADRGSAYADIPPESYPPMKSACACSCASCPACSCKSAAFCASAVCAVSFSS